MSWPRKFAVTGDKTRIAALKEFNIKPVQRMTLIGNQSRITYFDQPITTEYYMFEFEEKADKNNKGFFYCGEHAANGWLELIKHPRLPLFNPLIDEQEDNGGNQERRPNANIEPVVRNQQKRDLILVLRTIITIYDFTTPNSAIFSVLKNLESDLSTPPSDAELKSSNTITYKILNRNYGNYRNFIESKTVELAINRPFRNIDAESLNERIQILMTNSDYQYPAYF